MAARSRRSRSTPDTRPGRTLSQLAHPVLPMSRFDLHGPEAHAPGPHRADVRRLFAGAIGGIAINVVKRGNALGAMDERD